jgi:hypothetical protein
LNRPSRERSHGGALQKRKLNNCKIPAGNNLHVNSPRISFALMPISQLQPWLKVKLAMKLNPSGKW